MKSQALQKQPADLENRIDIIEEILGLSLYGEGKKIFYSDRFTRRVFDKDCGFGRLKIIEDFFSEKGVYLYYVSFFAYIAEQAQFSIKADDICQGGISGKTGIFIQKEKQSFLIPNSPVIRRWNKRRHVVHERSDYYTEYRNQSIAFEVDFSENEGFELIVLGIPDKEIFSLSHIYKNSKEYTLTGPWVFISPLLDCWRFMVEGKIYEYRDRIPDYNGFKSQQAALSLYKLIHTQKDYAEHWVGLIKDAIAYSVLLDLEPDGRWVHGCWSDEMETHTRFQIDGIHLLLDYFKETKEPIFLEKALLGTNYLLSLTDVLQDGAIWFLHDTLEFGKHYVYPVVKSRAFKKSETNILCLNTHLSALCVLIRLYSETKKEELKVAIERGLRAAEMVLRAEPATSLYRMLYYLVDLSFDRPISKKFPNLKEALKIVIGKGASNLLPFVKKVFPRFVMPNGFTTRDLSLRYESYHYHIINLYDMLVLYQLLVLNGYKRHNWLWDSIDKAVKYCFKGHLVEFLIRNRDIFVPQLIEALIIYASFNDKFDKRSLAQIALTLRDNGYKFTSGSYGFDDLVTPNEYQVSGVSLGAYNPDMEFFNTSPRDKKFKEILVVNTGSKREKIGIICKNNKRLEVISSNGERIESPWLLGSRDYLLIRLYDI